MGRYLLMVCVAMALAGCARPDSIIATPAGPGEKTIEMRASSFAFDPNIIQARHGEQLLLLVENVSAIEHNITILDPSGETVVARDLPTGATVPVKLTLSETGDYLFYCNKPAHPRFGMSGRLEVR
jgi:plastocyanin